MRHYHFFYVSTDAKRKTCTRPTFLCWRQLFTHPAYACMKQTFLTKEDTPFHIGFSKLVYSKRKITLVRFKTQTHIVEETKMLIKLIVVDSNHFIRYKYKITHCLNSQTLSEYISTMFLDKNEKLSISEVLQVLPGVGTFTVQVVSICKAINFSQ